MERRHFIVYLIFLIVLLLAVGNYIHIVKVKKTIDHLSMSKTLEEGKYTIHIEVDKNRLTLVDRQNDEIIRTYPVATGKPSSPTPLGSFEISDKGKWGEGFGSRWIGLDIPWGRYGIHGTNRPGSIGSGASAGCIRMQNAHIEDLYELISENTNVLITNNSYGLFGSYMRTLKPGDRGSDVLEVQKRLNQQGYYEFALDGIYGEVMKKSIINFLNDQNIPLTDHITEEIHNKLGIVFME